MNELTGINLTRRSFLGTTAMALAVLGLGGATTVALPEEAHAAVAYGRVGHHCTKSNPTSGRLIVGDSRTCQLWNYKNSGASFVSVWGGHFGYGGSNGQIDTAAQRKHMKAYVEKTIAKKGYCNVYVFATVNDYNGGSAYKGAAGNVLSLAKTIAGYTGTYKGKKAKCKVTVVGLVGSKGKNVSTYNSYLKKSLPSHIGWLSIGGCLGGSNKGYMSDNVHYNNTTLKNIWAKLK